MIFERVFSIFFISLIALAVMHSVAIEWYLYWMYPWFDIGMHFAGGMIVALGSQTLLFQKITRQYVTGLFSCLLVVGGVSILWEIFEWYSVIIDFEGYRMDTSIDLVMDILGGICGFYFASFLRRHFI